MLRRLLTLFGYLGLILLVVGVTVALVAYGNDYVYDFSAKTIIQKGHVIIASAPNGVEVSEGGRDLGKRTPYQAAHKVGMHTFKLERDGFWPWEKTFDVVAGQVSLARYVIMVPKNPTETVLDKEISPVTAQVMSKDRRHLAYIAGGAAPAVYTLDLGNPKAVKLYTPMAGEGLSSVMWSDDASHLLIVSVVNGQPVHHLASAGGGVPINLTAQYGYNFTGLTFSASNWRQLYWISPDGLRRLDAGASTVSGVLAQNVSQFVAASGRILYVRYTPTGRSLWSLDDRDRSQELIQALVDSESYSIAYGSYRGDEQVAIVPAKTQIGTLYTGLFGDTPVAKTLARGVNAASFSPDGHFLLFTAPANMVTYDLERSAIGGVSVLYSITGQPGTLEGLTWFDNFHMLVTRSGRLYWCEFDGANRVDLGAVATGLPAYRTSDFKAVVAFRPDGAGMKVVQTQIKP